MVKERLAEQRTLLYPIQDNKKAEISAVWDFIYVYVSAMWVWVLMGDRRGYWGVWSWIYRICEPRSVVLGTILGSSIRAVCVLHCWRSLSLSLSISLSLSLSLYLFPASQAEDSKPIYRAGQGCPQCLESSLSPAPRDLNSLIHLSGIKLKPLSTCFYDSFDFSVLI